MKKIILLLIITLNLNGFSQITTEIESKTKVGKKLFAETENQIKKYRADSQKCWDKKDRENALKYDDSIKNLILNSYIGNYKLRAVDGTIYDTSKRKKPLFLQVSASWCTPCRFEVSALNRIVEKYSDKVDFVLLFWDTQFELEILVPEYNKKIVLIPSPKKQSEPTTIDISGFRHIMGYPTNYLITTNNQIINYSGGATIPITYTDQNGKEITITEDEADKENYERLEKQIKELLEKNGVNNMHKQ